MAPRPESSVPPETPADNRYPAGDLCVCEVFDNLITDGIGLEMTHEKAIGLLGTEKEKIMRLMTQQERSRFNALLSCRPMSRRYQLVRDDEELGMEVLASADNASEFTRAFPGLGKKIFVIDKDAMMVVWEKEGLPLRVPLPYSA